ncbi:MAG: PKD-like domain-containing protein [Bacteroidota bacterium]
MIDQIQLPKFRSLHFPWFAVAVSLIFFHFTGFGQLVVNPDTTICLGGTATLTGQNTGGGYGTNSYSFQLYPYSPEPYTGGTAVTFGSNQDDQIAGPFDIGFTFCFFNATYSQFYIGTNGWIGFTYNSAWTTFSPDTLPNSNSGVPKNCIMAPWQDWHPGVTSGFGPPYIYYYTTGIAPFRKLVAYWSNCPLYGCTTTYGTFQIVLNEQNSIIENHLTNKPACNSWQLNRATQGVQNDLGTVAFTAAGRNNSSWTTTNESTRFVPDGMTWYQGSYPTGPIVGYTSQINVSPTVTTRYTCASSKCGGAVDTASVVVHVVNPTFNYSANSFCQSLGTAIPTIVQSGGTFISLPAGLVFISNLTGMIDLTASTPGTYSVLYTLTSGPATCNSSKTVTIFANPPAPIALPDTFARCGPGPITMNVTIGAHQTAKWFNAPTGGTAYPFTGPSVTANILDTTHFWTETYDSISTCISTTRTEVTALMKPIPTITNSILKDTICSGFPNNFNINNNLLLTLNSWSASCTLGSVSGFTVNGSGTLIHDTLYNLLGTKGTVTYHVTPTRTGCTGPAVNFITVVRPKPFITLNPQFDTICSGQKAMINYSSNVAGTQITWSVTSNSSNITGFSSGTGYSISQTLINNGVIPYTVTYTITPFFDGCFGVPVVAIIQVNPKPILTVSPPTQSVCNATPTSISLSSSVAIAVNSWTVTGSSPNVSGFSTGNGNTISQTLSNTGFSVENATYRIKSIGYGCSSDTSVYPVTVYPVSDVYFSPISITQCSEQVANINLLSHVTGANFAWTASSGSGSVSGFGSGSGNTITQTLINSGLTPGSVNYLVSPSISTCPGISKTYTVNINPLPNTLFPFCNDTITTFDAKPYYLKGGIPLGGIYTGNGVNPATGIFNPTSAGAGIHLITYTYSNQYNCQKSAFRNIEVINSTPFICGNDFTDIRDGKIYSTVWIPSQCWMATNLNYGKSILSSQMQRDNCTVEKYCYSDVVANCALTGGLYQWDEMMRFRNTEGIQGLCPPEWHVPTESEWSLLFTNFISSGFAGSGLKITGFSGFNDLLS